MRSYPLVPMALCLMIGIAMGHWIEGVGAEVFMVGIGVAAVVVGLLLMFRRRALAALGFMIAMIGATECKITDPKYAANDWGCHEVSQPYLALHIVETPYPRGKTIRCKARVESVDGQRTNGNIRLYLRSDSLSATLGYGDRLLAHGYPDYGRRDLYLTADHYMILQRDATSLRARMEWLRMRLVARMQRGDLSSGQAAVAEALVLGWRADLEEGVQQQYRDAGIAHLLCVSGLHVGLLASLVGGALFWVGRTRRGRIVRGTIMLLAIWIFALLSGKAPATMRAALMFTLFVVSWVLGRRTPSLNLLAATALVTLIAQPMLLFDVGWQLSYSAVGAILLVGPLVRTTRLKVVRSAEVSMAATVGTMPFVLGLFGRFPLFFLATNVVVVPLSGLLLGGSLLYLVFPHETLVVGPLSMAIGLVDRLTCWVSELPYGVLQVGTMSGWEMVLVGVACFSLLVAIKPIVERYSESKRDAIC